MPLTPAVVLDAAITHLDEVGLDTFSSRKLATRLGVRVGALYWHYPSKQALLDAVAEHIIGEAYAVPVPDDDWPDQARAMIHALRDAMLAHTHGARVIAEMSTPGPTAQAYIERLRGLLTGAGMDRPTAEGAADVLTSYLSGYTIEEQAHKVGRQRADADRRFTFGVARGGGPAGPAHRRTCYGTSTGWSRTHSHDPSDWRRAISTVISPVVSVDAVSATSPLTSAGCCLPGDSTGAAATNCSYTLRISACPVARLPGGNASTASGAYNATSPSTSPALAHSMKYLPRSFGSVATALLVMVPSLPTNHDIPCRVFP
jgi:TetR/AcrR family tetracycline transcriptional repressor